MPEPELLREFLGDPAGRIKCPTVAQDMLFGAKGRVFQLRQYLRAASATASRRTTCASLRAFLTANEASGRARHRRRADRADARWVPEELRGAVAPPVAQRLREGHAPARAGAGRRPQPRADRRRAEPARLPGRLGRPPHPFRQRRAALRARGDGGIQRADRPRIQADPDLHVRRRRVRHDRPRLGHRRRPGGRRRTCAARARRSA